MLCSAVVLAGAGTAALPFAQINGIASRQIFVREIKVFTTAANDARILVKRYSTTAPTGTAVTEEVIHGADIGQAPVAVVVHSVSAAGTDEGNVDVGAVGAAIGSGFHYSYWDGPGLWIPSATTNGIGLIEVADTANTYDVTFIWEE
jgi:hypothetical protein